METVYDFTMAITGLDKITAMWDKQPWLAGVLILCVILSQVWMIRLMPRVTTEISKLCGGPVFALIKIAAGFVLYVFLVHWIVGMGLGQITGGLHQFANKLDGIFIIGWLFSWIFELLADILDFAFALLAGLVVSVLIGWHILKGLPSILSQLMGEVKSGAGDWRADEGEGLLKVKWTHVIPITSMASGLICHPAWNVGYWCGPGALSATVGIVSLFYTTDRGRTIIENATTKAKGGCRTSDDAWRCRNYGTMPVLDPKTGKPVRNAQGKIKGIKGRCPGPQGINPETGKPYDGWNPEDAPQCLCDLCDHPNPYRQVCESCGYAGKGKKGFPREPNKSCRCPKCRHVHPAHPATTPFHLPDKDVANPRTVKKQKEEKAKATTKAQPPQPTAPQPPPPPPPVTTGSLTGRATDLWTACPSCKGDIDPSLGEKFCPHCGEPLAGGQVAAPPQPTKKDPPKAEPPKAPSKPWKKSF